jgi:hypothetical protein
MKNFENFVNEGHNDPVETVLKKKLVILGKETADIVGKVVTRKSGFTPYIYLVEKFVLLPTGFAPHGRTTEDSKILWKGSIVDSKKSAISKIDEALKSLEIK